MPNKFATLVNIFRTRLFFWLLVPIFFMLKNINSYFTSFPAIQLLWLFTKYLAMAAALYGLLWLLTRRQNYKAALACFLLLMLYFFFNDFDSWLQSQIWIHPFNRYRWSLPALAILVLAMLVIIFRLKRPNPTTIAFLNILLVLFCLSEGIPVLFKVLKPPTPTLTLESRYAPVFQPAAGLRRHDIYFLLLDEYQGNPGLQQLFRYDNREWKEFMKEKGFFSPDTSRSNYQYTAFSMASIFNMDYFKEDIRGKDKIDQNLIFTDAFRLLQSPSLVKFLQDIGYSITNLSPFFLDGSSEHSIPVRTIVAQKDLIENQTFFNAFKTKFGWLIPNEKIWIRMNPFYTSNRVYNNTVRESLVEESGKSEKERRFVYAHFLIPHFPFLKDSAGHDISYREFIPDHGNHMPNYSDRRYLGYLQYGNRLFMKTIDTLVMNDPGSIIIVMSDHGFRGVRPEDHMYQFDTQFYIRTPGGDYSGWPQTVDAVNVFRILLNTEFSQHLEYLPYKSLELGLPDPGTPPGAGR
jgi:hypothetical protein